MKMEIETKIERLLSEIEKETLNNEIETIEDIEKLCLGISSKITVKSKGIMSSLYTILSKETLEQEIFRKNANANAFYELDLRSKIYEKYNFDSAYKIDFNGMSSQFIAGGTAVGTTSMGVALSLSLTQAIIIPIALIVGVGLYIIIKKHVDNKNKREYITQYIRGLKCELLKWFDNIESYYNKEVNKLIKKLEV